MKQKALHSVGDQIKAARSAPPAITLRELSRRSGISAGQLSRIEGGETARPSEDTLRAIAAALGADPAPLLYLAGHISEEEATGYMAVLAEEIQGVSELAEQGPADFLDEFEGDMKRGASYLFLQTRMLREELLSLLDAAGAGSGLQELASAWPALTPERQRFVLAVVSDQEALSRLDRLPGARGRLEFDVTLRSPEGQEGSR